MSMNLNNISSKCAVELLEVFKNLDDNLKQELPEGFEFYLDSIKDEEYFFQIDKNVKLFENKFMDETIEILSKIFLK